MSTKCSTIKLQDYLYPQMESNHLVLDVNQADHHYLLGAFVELIGFEPMTPLQAFLKNYVFRPVMLDKLS